jgi:hypothetical protein
LVLPLVLFQCGQWWSDDLEPVRGWPFGWRVLAYAAVAAGIVLLGEDFGEPFIYFQF